MTELLLTLVGMTELLLTPVGMTELLREGIAQAEREEFSGGGEMDASRRGDAELPTSRAKNAREMGHPAQADGEEFIEEEEMGARTERMLRP